nr:unnamed protein product [uncultured bacterium]
MLDWLAALLPVAEGYEFISYLAGAALVIAFACIAISAFMGIFVSIFRQ